MRGAEERGGWGGVGGGAGGGGEAMVEEGVSVKLKVEEAGRIVGVGVCAEVRVEWMLGGDAVKEEMNGGDWVEGVGVVRSGVVYGEMEGVNGRSV